MIKEMELLTLDPLEELLAQGRTRGYVTISEILDATSDEDNQLERLEEFLLLLEEEGIDVYENGDVEAVEELPEEEAFEAISPEELAREKAAEGMLDAIETDDTVSLYFRDVRPIPLLSREEEIELAKQIKRGKRAEKRLRRGDLTPEERARLEAEVRKGEEALQRLVQANFRLVISIAKNYVGQGVPLLDLIQEGNLGLMRAAEKFDYRRGYKFSTYATWWIRQAVTRAVADQGRTIRLPVHMKDRIQKLKRLSSQLKKELGHEPSPEEIAAESSLSLEQVKQALQAAQYPLPLEKPVGEEEDNELGDFIESEDTPDPAEEVDHALLQEEIQELLASLTPREARVLALRYGLIDGREYTLKELGQKFGLTRERIRQIEQQALRKLRHPRRSQRLRAYLN
jgi:RNA polymerase primary sigma factor